MKIFVNGALQDAEEAKVSVFDHGFMYGIGLFETFRTYEGKPFLLVRHMDRLSDACKWLDIDWERDDLRTQQQIETLLQENGWRDAYIRYSVSAGNDMLGLPAGPYREPNVIIYAKPLPPMPEELYIEGKPLQKLRTTRNTPETPIRFKSFHYMNNIAAKRELAQYSWASSAEGLMLTEQGHVSEGIVSNLFFVKGDCVYTPSEDTGILPGITRSFVLELCSVLHVSWQMGHYTWEDLLEADEIFVTNSIQEIVPITSLYDENGNQSIVGDGVIGAITAALLQAYREHVGR